MANVGNVFYPTFTNVFFLNFLHVFLTFLTFFSFSSQRLLHLCYILHCCSGQASTRYELIPLQTVQYRSLKLRSGRIDYTVVCFMTHDCSRKLRKHSTTSASWVWFKSDSHIASCQLPVKLRIDRGTTGQGGGGTCPLTFSYAIFYC